MKASNNKPVPKKSKEVVEDKILMDFLNSGSLYNFIKKKLLEGNNDDELFTLSPLFCSKCWNFKHEPVVDPANAKAQRKVKKPRAKTGRVLSPEHVAAMQKARAEKRKKKMEEGIIATTCVQQAEPSPIPEPVPMPESE